MTYLITFSCYGTHLHGDERGSVDRNHNQPGCPGRPEEPELQRFERDEMGQPAYLLDEQRGHIVLAAIRSVADYRRWPLLAAHVRTNHVHLVVDLDGRTEAAAHDFKAYSSRALNTAGVDQPGRKRWTRGFSVRALRDDEARRRAVKYVADQGEPMAMYVRQEGLCG